MPFQKVEFEFPDPEETSTEIEIEPSNEVEILSLIHISEPTRPY